MDLKKLSCKSRKIYFVTMSHQAHKRLQGKEQRIEVFHSAVLIWKYGRNCLLIVLAIELLQPPSTMLGKIFIITSMRESYTIHKFSNKVLTLGNVPVVNVLPKLCQ